jgi:hypothetical protein
VHQASLGRHSSGRGISLSPIFLGLEELEDSERSVGFGDMAREYYKATCEAVILTIWFWGSDPMGNRGNTDRIPNL